MKVMIDTNMHTARRMNTTGFVSSAFKIFGSGFTGKYSKVI